MPDEYTDRFFAVNGCRLHVQDWGNAAVPPLLFVHGLTQQSHAFDGAARRLRGRFRCLALDVRGRGDSEWAAPESYTLAQYAQDVLALLDALGIAATDYVGTSMGGLTAMAIARKAPQRLRRVVLNDIGPELAEAGLQRIAASVGERSGSFASVDDFIERGLLPYFYWLAARPREQVRELARWGLREQPDGTWRVKYDPAVQGGAASDPETRRKAAAFLWAGFRAFAGPLLLIRGAESDLLARETVNAMQEAQPGLRVAEVPGVSHAPTLDEPEAAAALEAFFA
ncbi:MAG TPA: alpha/beta hydrolase [bacterium]|jgi:pimeloyl-ACP methyl ester carboxylesterase